MASKAGARSIDSVQPLYTLFSLHLRFVCVVMTKAFLHGAPNRYLLAAWSQREDSVCSHNDH